MKFNYRPSLAIGLVAYLSLSLTSCTSKQLYKALENGFGTGEIIILFVIIPYTLSLIGLYIDYKIHFRNSRKGRSLKRFGVELDQMTYTIGGKEDWSQEQAFRLAAEIQNRVFEGLNARLASKIKNTDDPNDRVAYGLGKGYQFDIRYSKVMKQNRSKKQFLIVRCLHPSKIILKYLVSYDVIGNFTIAHHLVYLKGQNRTFYLFLLWLLLPKYLLLSIILKLGNLVKDYINVIDNSLFDTLDINGFRNICHESIVESTEKILKEKGLMTEQIQAIINQSIINQNVSNTQNLNVSGHGHSLMGFNQSNAVSN